MSSPVPSARVQSFQGRRYSRIVFIRRMDLEPWHHDAAYEHTPDHDRHPRHDGKVHEHDPQVEQRDEPAEHGKEREEKVKRQYEIGGERLPQDDAWNSQPSDRITTLIANPRRRTAACPIRDSSKSRTQQR